VGVLMCRVLSFFGGGAAIKSRLVLSCAGLPQGIAPTPPMQILVSGVAKSDLKTHQRSLHSSRDCLERGDKASLNVTIKAESLM